MIQLIELQGLPGSGKSTFAREWVNEAPKERVIVNRDSIRRMLGPYWIPTREDLVTEIERDTVRSSLRNGYSVLVDATNFKDGWIREIFEITKRYKEIEFIVKSFIDVPIEVCIERDKNRPKEEQVGEEVIRNFAKNYEHLFHG